MADARAVRCDLLPQRDDLFRSAYTRTARTSLCTNARTQWIPLHWALRVHSHRNGARAFGWQNYLSAERELMHKPSANLPRALPGFETIRRYQHPTGHYIAKLLP